MSDPALIHDVAGPSTMAPEPSGTPIAPRARVLPDVYARFAGTPRWLVTFADLVALLVAFFVMILSMSSFEPEALARLNGAPAGADGASNASVPSRATGEALSNEIDISDGAGARYVASLLLGQLAALGVDQGVTVNASGQGVMLVLPASALADNETGREVRVVLGRLAKAAPGRITLLGAALIGDARSLYEAAPFEAAGVSTDMDLGIGVGVAGWLAQGQAAIAIRNPVRAALQPGGRIAR